MLFGPQMAQAILFFAMNEVVEYEFDFFLPKLFVAIGRRRFFNPCVLLDPAGNLVPFLRTAFDWLKLETGDDKSCRVEPQVISLGGKEGSLYDSDTLH